MIISKKIVKPFLFFLLVFSLVMGAIWGISKVVADEANEDDTVTETIVIEGILANDFFISEPRTYGEALALADTRPKERTGWSVKFYACLHDQIGLPNGESDKNSPWRETDIQVTDDSGRDKRYSVADYYDQIIDLYGQEEGERIYELAIEQDVQLVYDQTRGKHMISSYLDTPLPCQDGDLGFYYNNMDFFLTTTFEVNKEKVRACEDYTSMELLDLFLKGELSEDCSVPPELLKCKEDPATCKPIPTEEIPYPKNFTPSQCPMPNIPEQLTKIYEYEIDLITERIEGKTVDIGQTTRTPVTVYRETFEEERTEIKDGLIAELVALSIMQDECNEIIKKLKEKINKLKEQLDKLQEQLAQMQEAYAVCQASYYLEWDIDSDGNWYSYEVPYDCSHYPPILNNIQAQIDLTKTLLAETIEELKKAEKALEEIEELIVAVEAYINQINKMEEMFKTIYTTVSLYVNDEELQELPVVLSEKERKTLYYEWILEGDSIIKGWIDPENPDEIYPVCNEELHPCETTNDNNTKETPIYISTREVVKSCTLDGSTSTLEGIVRTIQEGDSLSDVEFIKERATSRIEIEPNEKNRRAGYGFHYKVFTTYENADIADDRDTTGIRDIQGFKPTIVERYMPYDYKTWKPLKTYSTQGHIKANILRLEGFSIETYENTDKVVNQNDGAAFVQLFKWELPRYAIEKFSGEIYEGNFDDILTMTKADQPLLDGGRKWYTDFALSDRDYRYQILVEDIGVNRLSLCSEGLVQIEGKPIGDKNGNNDFVFRFVDANNPFPKGTGWNWSNDESKITAIKEWFISLIGNEKTDHENHYEIQHEMKNQ